MNGHLVGLVNVQTSSINIIIGKFVALMMTQNISHSGYRFTNPAKHIFYGNFDII